MLPANNLTFRRHVAALKRVNLSGFGTDAIVRAALSSWMQHQCPNLQAPEHSEQLAELPAVAKFSSWLGKQDVITGAFWLSSAYAALVPSDVRKNEALYFTPPLLSSRLLDIVEDKRGSLRNCRLIDPACGGGAFLAPVALRIKEALQAKGASAKIILNHIEKNLYGCDTDEFLCFLSASFLRMVLADVLATVGREPEFNIAVGDGLTLFEKDLGKFDLVVCNPPYRKMQKSELPPYAIRHKEIIKGQPNLYSLFIQRASQLLANGGIATLLTPMSFLAGHSFSGVRSFLAIEGNVLQLDLIHQRKGVFLSAEQDTVITSWKKGRSVEATTEVSFLTSDEKCDSKGPLTIPTSTEPWPIPRQASDFALLKLFSQPHARLFDYGYAPRTGAIVIHRDKRLRYLAETDGKDAKALVPLIWSRNIGADGKLSMDKPLGGNVDKFVEMESLAHSSVIKNPSVVLQRVSSSEQPRRLVCAPIPQSLLNKFGGVVGENHVCFLEKTDIGSPISPELLSSILRTTTVDRLSRCISGATNVSAYELLHLPLPSPTAVIEALHTGVDINLAVDIAFGLVESPLRKPSDIAAPGESLDGWSQERHKRNAKAVKNTVRV